MYDSALSLHYVRSRRSLHTIDELIFVFAALLGNLKGTEAILGTFIIMREIFSGLSYFAYGKLM